MRYGLGVALAAVAMMGTAQAATIKKTDYRFYPVSGVTPYDINQSILSHGPKFGGLSAYGVTTYDYKPSATCDASSGADARVGYFKMELQFLIKLPKLSSEPSLSSDVRASWGKFSGFVRHHEETHRSIWLACARSAETKINALRAKSCPALSKKIDQVLFTMSKSCNRQHEAFDAAEQKRLARHPFMQKVKNAARNARALKAQ